MTKKKMLSILCAVTMVGAFSAPVFAQPTETGPGDIENSYNTDTDVDVPISDSFQDNTDNSTRTDIDVPISDSFQDNSDNSTKTDIDVPIEDSFKIEKNNNRKYMTHTMTQDSYNTYENEDKSVNLNATLAQVSAGPIGFGFPSLGMAVDNGRLPGESVKNELDLCTSFNDWSGINNNAMNAGSYNNAGNLNAIAVGSGSVGR